MRYGEFQIEIEPLCDDDHFDWALTVTHANGRQETGRVSGNWHLAERFARRIADDFKGAKEGWSI